ncbi:MAG: hypothetical protein HEQ16_13560 [Bosea sp.]|nr:hypothetical protein [Bosea sp. (in: a-proteobacteria)]
MASLTILYWRDIPAQILAREGRQSARRELSLRFTEAIDMAAMRSGTMESEAYLAEWRRGVPEPCEDNLEEAADRLMSEIEAAYPDARLAVLANAGGRETAA